MKKTDWIIHYVANGAVCEECGKVESGFINGFCNAHTHGMERYHHPDFQMVLDCGPQEICRILNTFGFAVRNGSRFHSGQFVTGIYEDCAVKLLEYKECDRTVLRVIIPDRHNRFPDERDCELPYAMQLMENSDVFYNLFFVYRNYNRTPNVVTPSAYRQIFSRWGIEGVRQFLTMYLETPVTTFPGGSVFHQLFTRFDPTVKYYAYNAERTPVCETVFDLQSMIDYMFCECTRQGYAENPSGFWSQWSDYMNQQVLLYGEVRDKYSEHLASDEQVLTYRCSKLKMQASQEMFQKASDFLSDFEYSSGPYCILAPKKPDDLIEEGRQLSHCVGSYTDRVAAQDTYIFFLRKTSEPDRSQVTVQVNPDGSLGQVKGCFNRQPSAEQLRFVEKWHEKFFKNAEVQVA